MLAHSHAPTASTQKRDTVRTAVAAARVVLGPRVFELVASNQLAKGDVLTVAQLAGAQRCVWIWGPQWFGCWAHGASAGGVHPPAEPRPSAPAPASLPHPIAPHPAPAGVMGAKHTASLIPLCHNILLSKVHVALALAPEAAAVDVRAEATTVGPTGVEMEALTAAAVAALTVYDMCKVRAHLSCGGPTRMAGCGCRARLGSKGRHSSWAAGGGCMATCVSAQLCTADGASLGTRLIQPPTALPTPHMPLPPGLPQAASKSVVIADLRLLAKSGGKSGDWRAAGSDGSEQ